MRRRLALFAAMLAVVAACGPQPLPNAPTSIPTLAPATMPAYTAAPQPTLAPSAGKTTAPAGETSAPAATVDLVQAGSQIFEQNCAICHNLTAESKVGPGLAGLFSLSNLPNGQPFNEENLKGWIQSGGGGMPGFSFSDQQMTELVAFLKDATK